MTLDSKQYLTAVAEKTASYKS